MICTSEVLDFPQFNHIRLTIKNEGEVTSLCYLSPPAELLFSSFYSVRSTSATRRQRTGKRSFSSAAAFSIR